MTPLLKLFSFALDDLETYRAVEYSRTLSHWFLTRPSSKKNFTCILPPQIYSGLYGNGGHLPIDVSHNSLCKFFKKNFAWNDPQRPPAQTLLDTFPFMFSRITFLKLFHWIALKNLGWDGFCGSLHISQKLFELKWFLIPEIIYLPKAKMSCSLYIILNFSLLQFKNDRSSYFGT